MIRDAIARLVSGESLDQSEAEAAMAEIMAGEATPAQIAAFVTALRLKGETVDEIAGFARAMRQRATPVVTSRPVTDTCGTGGDDSGTFNISTAAAFVAAGAGLCVAKHGNRAVTSRCGSADVLEALGVEISLGPEGVARCLEEVGVGFMFAPIYHPAMRHAAGPRREIGFRTVFNVLGPLTNPAGAAAQVVGVPNRGLVEKLAGALVRLGTRHALVVSGDDGLDELSISGPSYIGEVRKGEVTLYEVTPESVGLERAERGELAGGTATENAARIRAILTGEGPGSNGGGRSVVIFNAAAALLAGDLVSTLAEGVALAREALDSGRAAAKLDDLVALSRELAISASKAAA